MSIKFNADEILEMAAQIERNGGTFYRKAAQNNRDGRELLLEIAEQEDQHLSTFKEMRRELSNEEAIPTAFDPNGEVALYLRAMADGRVFDVRKDPADMLQGAETLVDIIKLAIGMEKDSIIFYLGMKEMVPRELGEDKIVRIIKEEMTHIRWLSEKLP